MKWFDREFSFDLPTWMYRNVIERLRGTPSRIEHLVRGLPADVLTRRDGERWSIQENVGHLLDLEPLWSGRVDDLTSRAERLRPADLENRKTHEASHNDAWFSSLLASFTASRAELVARLERLDDEAAAWSSMHPRLESPMRLIDHAFFVAEHDDHHLAEIARLRSRVAGGAGERPERSATILAPGEGRTYAMGRISAVFKADGAETLGRYTMSEWWLEPHTKGPGAHSHAEDDVFYVVEGTFTVLVGDRWVDAPAGTFVLIPGGTTHDFENRSGQRAGALNVSWPGDFERNMPAIVKWFEEHPPGRAGNGG